MKNITAKDLDRTNYCADCEQHAREIDRLREDLHSMLIRAEDAEILAERRKWGADEVDRLRRIIKAWEEGLVFVSGSSIYTTDVYPYRFDTPAEAYAALEKDGE